MSECDLVRNRLKIILYILLVMTIFASALILFGVPYSVIALILIPSNLIVAFIMGLEIISD